MHAFSKKHCLGTQRFLSASSAWWWSWSRSHMSPSASINYSTRVQ